MNVLRDVDNGLRVARRRFLGLLPAALVLKGRPAASAARREAEAAHALTLGDRSVIVRAHRSSAPGHFYLNLHENEATSIDAALAAADRFGGEVYWLEGGGQRLLTFHVQGRRFRIDPNRMFSPAGIDKNLRLYGAHSTAAAAEVTRFAMALTERLALSSRRPIVAVHNNTAGGLSVLSYLAGAGEHPDSADVSVSPGRSPDDFFLVTDRRLYDQLRAQGFNVVLQANDRVRDNGSLSVWAARHRVRYVNVEAQHGHFEQQLDMLAALQAWTSGD